MKRREYLLILMVVFALAFAVFGCGQETQPVDEPQPDEESQEIEEAGEEIELIYTAKKWQEINELAHSPDGEILAVGAEELELFSVSGREIIASGKDIDEGDRPESRSLNFSPDGSFLTAAWRGVSIYDTEDLTKIKNIHGGNECRVAISPDGKMLATHRTQMSGEVILWTSENGQDFERAAEFSPDGDMIHAIEFTPDGEYVAGGFGDGKVRLWNVETHEMELTLDLDSHGDNYNLTFSPDGNILAASEPDLGREIHLFNFKEGTRERVLDPGGRVSSMKFSPDGAKLAYGKFDGEMNILNTEDWSQVHSFEHDASVNSLSFSPDTSQLAVGIEGGSLYLYRIR